VNKEARHHVRLEHDRGQDPGEDGGAHVQAGVPSDLSSGERCDELQPQFDEPVLVGLLSDVIIDPSSRSYWARRSRSFTASPASVCSSRRRRSSTCVPGHCLATSIGFAGGRHLTLPLALPLGMNPARQAGTGHAAFTSREPLTSVRPSASQPTSRADLARLRADRRRDSAHRRRGSRGPPARPRSLATYRVGRAPRPTP